MQNTLKAWNEYLKHNDHKNKIIRQTKYTHFRLQMHKLSDTLKSIWCFAKWVKFKSQLSKKLSQFSSLKWNDTNHMITTFEEKLRCCKRNSFLHFHKQILITFQIHLYLWQYHQIHAFQRMRWSEQLNK